MANLSTAADCTAAVFVAVQSKGPKVLDGPSDCGEGEKMALLLGVEAGLTIIVSPVKGFCGFWTRVVMVGRPSNTALSC